MKPPNHGLPHRVTITDVDDDGIEYGDDKTEFEGYLALALPAGQFTGLVLLPDGLLIDATDRIEVMR